MMRILFVFSLLFSALEAAYVLKDGKLINVEDLATLPLEEHYKRGMEALNSRDFKEAAHHFHVISFNFPHSQYGQDSFFYLGVANFKLAEYDFANEAFSSYLKQQTEPKFFEEAVEYKFAIAECFAHGAKRHFFDSKKLPKWASGEDLALTIFEEVISAMPGSDLGAKALFSKACLLANMGQYNESVDTFQRLQRRFLKHELTLESYLMVSIVYLEQAKKEPQNPDILSFAELNLKRFREAFPKEAKITLAEDRFLQMKEVYAGGLFETGRFYEKIGKPGASILYYRKVALNFKETETARLSKMRLQKLCGIGIQKDAKAFTSNDS